MTIRRAKDVDALSIINPTASTPTVQQHSPWLTLTCHAWDTTTGGGVDTTIPWMIRNEGYASPGSGGGCLVFKVISQYIRRPFAIDEQGRMLLAYGSGPFNDQDAGPYYGFNGEDFGQWPIILAANIGGLNKVVVGWPENNIVTDLYVTGKTYHTGTPVPLTNDGAALGSTLLQWSDLFVASGGVVNFANGNATITHSAGLLTFSTAIAGTSLALTKTTEQLRLGYDVTNYTSKVVGATGREVITTTVGGVTHSDAAWLIGSWPAYGTAYAFLGNNMLNQTVAGNYALMQDNAGNTYLNAASARILDLRIANASMATLTAGAMALTIPLHVTSSSPQAVLYYDGTHYTSFQAGSNGYLNITPSGGTINYIGNQYVTGYNLSRGPFYGASTWNHRNKADTGWITWGTINDSGSEAVLNLTVGAVTVSGAIGTAGLTIYNPTAATSGQQQHSPWLVLTGNGWDTYNNASGPVSWKLRTENYASPGPPGQVAPGGCFVMKVTGAQFIRRPVAIDEQGRMIMGYGQGPKTFEGENIYGFAGEDFGAGGSGGTGNWPIILAGDIAGLNRVVVGWPTENIVSDLYVTGKLAVNLMHGETLATSCTLSSGDATPTNGSEPDGSLYMKRGGALYHAASGVWTAMGVGLTSLNGLTGATQSFSNDTNVTIVSNGTTHTITWSGTLAAARIAGLPASQITSGTFPDGYLATISTPGKVSGGAIISGTIAGSTAFDSSGSITTTGLVLIKGASYTQSFTLKNPTASTAGSLVQHSPYLELICQAWDTSNSRNDEIPWRLINEAYASPGHGGGCLVFYTSSQYNRRPVAIDENGRMLLASGVGPYTINGESIYGFHGEDFGSYGNWPLILEGSIAGLNKVVVGSPPNNVTSNLYVTGVIYTMTSGARGTAHQVVGAQQAAIANATDATSVIARLNDLLATCRTHGLIAT